MDGIKTQSMILTPGLFHQLIMQPSYQDIVPEYSGAYGGQLQEFTIMPNVHIGLGQKLVDITRKQNILQRKDRSCNTNWNTIGITANRSIYVQELYGAVQNCEEEFYDGAMKDFREQSPVFRDMIAKIFQGAVGVDLTTNAYFGDIGRADDATGQFSWNKFDGIVTKIGNYIADETIPAAQNFAVPSGAMTPTDAYNYIKELYESRSDLMKAMDSMDLAMYIDYEWAYQYSQYLIATGVNTVKSIDWIENGVPVLKFNGMPIFVEKIWNPVLNVMNGGTMAHMGILTIRRNFVFGTNKNYGGGPDLNQAFRVWYDWHDDVWKYKMHLTGGTEIIAPKYVCFAMTEI